MKWNIHRRDEGHSRSREKGSLRIISMDDLAPPKSHLIHIQQDQKVSPTNSSSGLPDETAKDSIHAYQRSLSGSPQATILGKDTQQSNKPHRWTRFAKSHDNLKRESYPDNRQRDASANWRMHANEAASATPEPVRYIHPGDRNPSKRREHFKPYWSPQDIEEGLRKQTLYQGIIRFSKNRTDAYVTSDSLDYDIYIGGFADRNRALHGDLVAVELLNVDVVWEERKVREQRKLEDRNEKYSADQDTVTDEKEEENVKLVTEKEDEDEEDEEEKKPKYCGHIVGIILRPPNAIYAGNVTLDRFGSQKNNDLADDQQQNDTELTKDQLPRIAWFKPNDKRIPFIALRGRDIPRDLIENAEYYKTHLFAAEIRRWLIFDANPSGRVVKELGPMGELKTEREAILADSSINVASFTPVALQSLPETPWSIPAAEYQKRRDLRSERVFSIDPETAKDLDDALHIKELPDGLFEVGVHIADVSYFLKKGTPLDSEARKRGTSTYLVDSVIPMLPPLLCEELCSLNPGVERLAFSVIWKMDKQGKPVETWFGRTIIKSCAKLAYEDAQRVIEGFEMGPHVVIHGGHQAHAIYSDIFELYRMSVEMRQRRYANGSLSLNSVKLQFKLNEQGEPISVSQFHSKEANRLIEEFMLCANISVAKKILSVYPDEALLRRHEDPLERRLDQFIKVTEVLGIDFDAYSAGSLQESFDKIHNKVVKDILLVLVIRTMQRAKYFCSGSLDISKYHHYALDEPCYTHFTSPIRRYADVIVHRLLEAALALESNSTKRKVSNSPYNKKMLQKIAFDCNNRKDGARHAQDSSSLLYLSNYLSMVEKRDGPIYKKAEVIVIAKETYEIYLPEYGLEKRIYLKELPVDKFHFDKNTLALDIHWKRDVPVTMHNEEKIYMQERERKDDYSDEEEESEEDQVRDSLQALNLKEPDPNKHVNADDLIPPVVLDEATCLQRIQMFSSIDVRIQINNERSPPIINIYPVNPFSGEREASSNDTT
ncbi:MAG: hypothetical protein EXX96DRAFT_568371 [Benjaminiella poitrasii]|nr:MAG: hypothetical protein EXX96DRAFT_568371 [Benjaminiella poitrasii]